jgi:hypothetical protein
MTKDISRVADDILHGIDDALAYADKMNDFDSQIMTEKLKVLEADLKIYIEFYERDK